MLLFPDATQDTITVNITYLVGSRHEGYGETAWRTCSSTCCSRARRAIPTSRTSFTSRGARFNGTTSFDRTNYFETLPASDEQPRLGARSSKPTAWSTPSSEEGPRQRDDRGAQRVRDRARTAPAACSCAAHAAAAAYLWHNYGNPIIGERSDIESVPIERLQAFYRNYYQPDNAVLIVAGKFDEPARARAGRRSTSAPSRSRRAQLAGDLHRGADAGRRAHA